jgi:hypothetical protein
VLVQQVNLRVRDRTAYGNAATLGVLRVDFMSGRKGRGFGWAITVDQTLRCLGARQSLVHCPHVQHVTTYHQVA